MAEQSRFEFLLGGLLGEREELELVGILERLAGEVGLGRGEGLLEVRARLALALVQVALDPVHEDAAAPAVLDGLAGVPEPLLGPLQFLQQRQIVVPGDLCKRLLHNCLLGPGFREGPHILEVSCRKALTPGISRRRSWDKRSMTLEPQPCSV